MSGEAQDFLKISRDSVKEGMERIFRANMFSAATAFYTEMSALVEGYVKHKSEWDRASDEEKERLNDKHSRYDDYISLLDNWLYSSTVFSRNLFTHLKIKDRLSGDVMDFLASHCGGSLDIVLFDRHLRQAALVNEPILSYKQSISQSAEFADSSIFKERSLVTLADDSRLNDGEWKHNIIKMLSADYPMFAEYKFKKVRAFTTEGFKYIALYTLPEPDEKNASLTEIDPTSYRIIATEILNYYTERFNDKSDNEIDRNHFIVFPAPKSEQFETSFADAIRILAVSEQVVGENSHCDRRYNGFIVSPLPIGKLAELREHQIKLDKKQIRDSIKDLWKDGWPSGNGVEYATQKNELPQLYNQMYRFITNKRVFAVHMVNENQEKEAMLDAWAEFAAFLLSLQ
jgi:hypothetical protein